MNFSGWVAIPRSILNNTHTGHLSNSEQLVLLTLMLLADANTGSGYINAAAIRAYLPELKYGTAKRVLKSLEDKRLVYRRITPASNDLYPYWLHGYQLSNGPHKMSFTNLSQVFVTDDLNTLTYDGDAPAVAPAIAPAMRPAIAPAGAPNNNKDNDKDIHKDNPSGSMRGERNGERDGDSRSEHIGEGVVSGRCADGECMDALPLGIIFRDGDYYTENGGKLDAHAVDVLLGKDRTQ